MPLHKKSQWGDLNTSPEGTKLIAVGNAHGKSLLKSPDLSHENKQAKRKLYEVEDTYPCLLGSYKHECRKSSADPGS